MFEEIWNRGDDAAIDQLIADDFSNFGRTSDDPRGLVRTILGAWKDAFPDLHYDIEDELVDGDRVAHLVRLSGTFTGTLRHPLLGVIEPTNKHFSAAQIHIQRVRNGQIVEHSAVRDDFGMLVQLGVIDAEVRPA